MSNYVYIFSDTLQPLLNKIPHFDISVDSQVLKVNVTFTVNICSPVSGRALSKEPGYKVG